MLGGKQVSEMLEGEQRFPIAVRLPHDYRNDIDRLGDLYMIAPSGESVQLRQVAEIRTVQGPEMVNREDARRRVAVQASVRGRDLGGFVKAAQQKIARGMKIPSGYWLDWGGQFENQKRANQRLALVLPVTVCNLPQCQTGFLDSADRAVRAGGRNRSAMGARAEFELVRARSGGPEAPGYRGDRRLDYSDDPHSLFITDAVPVVYAGKDEKRAEERLVRIDNRKIGMRRRLDGRK